MYFSGKALAAFLVVFAIETFIALFVRDAFIRPYMGDVLVMGLMYAFCRIFSADRENRLPYALLVFAVAVEIGQYFQLADLLGLGDYRAARIILGSTFDWSDILFYAIGTLGLLAGRRWKIY